MLAEWKIPPTDPRLREMNTARWIFCHQMMMDAERRQLKRYARLLGTDLTLFSPKAEEAESMSGFEPVRAFPLVAMLAPEAFKRLSETDIDIIDNEIPEDQYEAETAALEKSGQLTQLDVLSTKLEEAAKVQRGVLKMSTGTPIWEPESGEPPPWEQPKPPEPEPPAPVPQAGGRLRMRRDG